jgi:hypothetical protein
MSRPTTCPADHQPYGCDDHLPTGVIETLLDAHGVQNYRTVEGQVFAFEEATMKDPATGQMVDASAWQVMPTKVHEVMHWLGY